jgi:hypothetical protein
MAFPFLAAATPFLTKAAGSVGSSLLAGGLSKLFGGDEGGEQGFDIVQNPLLGGLQQGQDFALDQLRGINQGELPMFFQNQIPALRGSLDANLRNTFFGQPGRRGEGLVGQALGIGAQTGVGPRSAVAGTNKQLQNFGLQSQAIDQFIAQQGIDITRETALNQPRTLASLATAARPQIVPFSQPATGGLNLGDDFLSSTSSGIEGLLNTVLKKKKKPGTTSADLGIDTAPSFSGISGSIPSRQPGGALPDFRQRQ